MKYLSIAVDGPSGAGKSTISRAVARRFGFLYVDTGAIYRAVGLAVTRAGKRTDVTEEVEPLLPGISVTLAQGVDGQRVLLNGEDVSALIRTPEASQNASKVSALPAVRAFLLEMQRDIARKNNCIMDGRDIGTVVLPDADLKIFLTASPEDRARRRTLELASRGTPQPYETVLEEIRQRDERDANRPVAPLRQAEDAVRMDTTGNTLEQSMGQMIDLVRERLQLK